MGKELILFTHIELSAFLFSLLFSPLFFVFGDGEFLTGSSSQRWFTEGCTTTLAVVALVVHKGEMDEVRIQKTTVLVVLARLGAGQQPG